MPKIGGLAAMLRLLTVAIPTSAIDWPLLVAILAAASMTLGNLAAFFQTSVTRLLAYSTISQVGYLLMSVSGIELPSVTSGTQKCAGTPPTLNSSPASTAMTPTATAPGEAAASAAGS